MLLSGLLRQAQTPSIVWVSYGFVTAPCAAVFRLSRRRACTYSYLCVIFNCGAGVELGASAAHGIIIPFVLIVVGFVRAVCRGAARTPFHDKRPAPAEKFSLGRQTFLMQLCASIRGKSRPRKLVDSC